MQTLSPFLTTWHITWGTYGARLHGGDRPTVERDHNSLGEDFIWRNDALYAAESGAMRHPPASLMLGQRRAVQELMPAICERGGWTLRTCAAQQDHIHVLLDIARAVHGGAVRELLKRWTTQALNELWPRPPSGSWWAKGGSTKAIKDEKYLNNAYNYVFAQRA